ncbi:MAG: hypothetical protein WCS33_00770 [Candidatus Caldatribacteriota bacterium]
MSDETRGKEWYGNKELYEMFLNLKKEFLELKAELSLTRQFIQQYNHLQKTLNLCMEKIDQLEKIEDITFGMSKGKKDILIAIRKWGGWVVGTAASAIAIYAHFT